MKKLLVSLLAVFMISGTAFAQVLSTETGYISFYSELEEIKAENNKVNSTLDTKKNTLLFTLQITDFEFPSKMMQKHFNQEGVMDSEKYPEATFKGKITDASSVDYKKDGVYSVIVKGDMTIKGVTQPVEEKGTITVKDGKVSAQTSFSLDRYTFGIEGKKNSVSQNLLIEVKVAY